MRTALILGGTRDIGHFAALELLAAGHSVAVLNRGRTPDELPPDVERLRADRNDTGSMRSALAAREFDLVLDTTTYDASAAEQAVELFRGRVGCYVFISTGQVYLVRTGLQRPFRESDYDGPLMAEPEHGTPDHDSWSYGVEKRDAEAILADAWARDRFPVITLRLPVVASERDPAGRVQAYVARLLDGGLVLVPAEMGLPLRHVYVNDVARLVSAFCTRPDAVGEAVNISCGESLTLERFIALLGELLGATPRIMRVERARLEAELLLPDCSPFSSRWVSELDNSRSRDVLARAGLAYTSPREYLALVARDYVQRWRQRGITPRGYDQRPRELSFAATGGSD